MPESNAYFRGVCRNCFTDCDGDFCSIECLEEWESGYGDYLHELEKDRRIQEESND